jgi:hypothetical protein
VGADGVVARVASRKLYNLAEATCMESVVTNLVSDQGVSYTIW